MPLSNFSNYPGGFSHGVTLYGMPVLNTYHGNVWWLDSTTGSNDGGSDGSKNQPFATLEYTIGRATANNGDIIMIAPAHAETVGTATTINFNKGGITMIGLGKGTNRPTFTFDTANTATIPVSAGNITVQNIRFIGNFLSIASCFTVAAGPDFQITNCFFDDTSAILGFLTIVTTTVSVDADGLVYNNNYRRSIATTTPGPCISILGTINGLTVQNNYEVHTVASNNVAALILHAALVVDGLLCTGNIIYSVNTDTLTGAIVVLTTATTGSGIIANNYVRCLDVAGGLVVTAAAVQYGTFENFWAGETTQLSGVILPARGAQ